MIVGIHIDPHKGFTATLKRYETILDYNGIDHIRLDVNKPDFWEQVKTVDLFIFHYYGTERQSIMAHTIIPVVENVLGIPCFPNTTVSWLYDDKVREYYFLQQNEIPVIPTWVFWNKSDAQAWLDQAKFPLVFKLWGGASSLNVILVKSKLTARKLTNRMFGGGIVSGHIPGFGSLKWKNMLTKEHWKIVGGKLKRRIKGEQGNPFEARHRNYVLFQKFLPGNFGDTRVHIIGNRALADVRLVRSHDFRASGSGKYTVNRERIDPRCIQIAFTVAKKFGFSSMAFDFLFDENNMPLISEISYTQPDAGVWGYPGWWDEQLTWHEGHSSMQYMILKDLLKREDLKQPDMKPDLDPDWTEVK